MTGKVSKDRAPGGPQKLSIVQWGKFYPPDWGGVESVTHDLATGYARLGHDSHVIAFSKSGDKEEVRDGVAVSRYRLWKEIASQPFSRRWIAAAAASAKRADIVQIHVPNPLAALPLLFVSKRPRVLLHWHSDLVNKGPLGLLVRPLEEWLLRRSDRLLATSPDYAESSPRLRRYREKVRVVPLGIADPADGRADLPLPERFSCFLKGRKLVLSVGRLVPYKGFDYLVGAADRLAEDAAIIIVGGGPLEAGLSSRIAEAGLEDKVLLAGRVPQEELASLFANASIYAMTSIERSEAFGVVQLEAMAYGVPVVATQIPGSGVGWVSGHGSTGASVPVRDSAALADALNGLLKRPGKLAEYSRAARRRYEEEFRLEHMLRRTLAAMTD